MKRGDDSQYAYTTGSFATGGAPLQSWKIGNIHLKFSKAGIQQVNSVSYGANNPPEETFVCFPRCVSILKIFGGVEILPLEVV